jgi:uncharacterized damage-inducible protein DinB
VLKAIRTSRDKTPRLLTLMAHIFSAEGLWLERLKGEPQSLPVWPEFDGKQCEERMEELAQLWSAYLHSMAADNLGGTISYANSKGESWNSTVQDVLTHVIMHSAYHRGQIASATRASGQTPAATDFIHAVRQRFIE